MTLNIFLKKIFFILFVILIIRIGSHLTIPTVNPMLIDFYLTNFNNDLLALLSTFSGGSVERFSILTIGIMPYITATIVIQLFTMGIPHFKRLKEEGEKGQLVLNSYIKYLTIITALSQGFYISGFVVSSNYMNTSLIMTDIVSFYLISCLSLLYGTLFLVWLGEKINEYGIGNGVSIIIFSSIIASLPNNIENILKLKELGISNAKFIFFFISIISLYYFIVFFENSYKKIYTINPNSYDKNNYIPYKVNLSGIMPAIFSFMLIMVPFHINDFFNNKFNIDIISNFKYYFGDYQVTFYIFILFLILCFSFFYSKTTMNTKKISDDLRRSGVIIKGLRPGNPTENYLNNIRKRLALIGGLYLFLVIIIPELINGVTNIYFYLGGTSLLIMVTVSFEIKNQYEMIKENKKENRIKKQIKEIFN